MSRLLSELQRLYSPPADANGPPGAVRALVLELARPADWDVLSRVWYGVQVDLELPAPAIAVSGIDGLQLWFSLQQPAASGDGAAFLAGLQAHYLADVAPARVRLMPPAEALPVPAEQPSTGNWSAFIAPDLAPVFVDTPWLDIQPGAEGQADLLAKLQGIKPAAWAAALRRLAPAASAAPEAPAAAAALHGTADIDPRRFLQRVLNDETAPLALRVDAAKALLGHPARRDD